MRDSIVQIILAAGGSTVVVLAVIAAVWKLTEKSIIEKIKHGFAEDLEILKSELMRSGERTNRYESAQFGKYQELWDSLGYLSDAAERLWQAATPQNLDEFDRQLQNAHRMVFNNRILLDENHLEDLDDALERFHEFYEGKQGLMELLRTEPNDSDLIKQGISRNEQIKNEFSDLVEAIGNSFRRNLRGEVN